MDTVYIDTKTVLERSAWLSDKDHLRSLYTAITRARKRVVFYEMRAHCAQALPEQVQLLQPMEVISTGGTDHGGGLLALAG